MRFSSFQRAVNTAGLQAVFRGPGHWQIAGGALLVNYYADTQKIYVAGTVKGFRGDVQAAIRAANTPPRCRGRRDDRRPAKRHRKALLRRDPYCNWCHCLLTEETATIEHIIPIARGGLDNRNNMTLACEACNKARGCNMPELAEAQ